MTQDHIGDLETLYRRVPNVNSHFGFPEGKLRFSSSAFNDAGFKPSVDRAALRKSPHESKKNLDDGIVELATNTIRAIKSVESESISHYIDVHYRPVVEVPTNIAHSQIEPAPEIVGKNIFKKLKDALARLADEAGWLIEPNSTDL